MIYVNAAKTTNATDQSDNIDSFGLLLDGLFTLAVRKLKISVWLERNRRCLKW